MADVETTTAPDRRSVFKQIAAAMSIGPVAAAALAVASDPISRMIGEAEELEERADALRERAEEIMLAMPPSLRASPRVRTWWGRTGIAFDNEQQLLESIAGDAVTPEERSAYLAEWRSAHALRNRAMEEAGCGPLYRQAEALEATCRRLSRQIAETKPTTIAGCIRQIEYMDTDERFIAVLAGLRDIAARAAA